MKDIVIAIIGSGVLSTIITSIVNYKVRSKESNERLEKAVVSLVGMQIRQGCEKAIQGNKISSEELKQLQSMNELYKDMGGNGFVKVLMNKIEKLEVYIED